ncbi:MAG: hypothetical protein CBC71_11075 [Rhodobacteraceae bacterium TMED111]|nr:MAG: hypothetical protein CBC71_11075 [Rhodobacteraceae bacterium TMED111]
MENLETQKKLHTALIAFKREFAGMKKSGKGNYHSYFTIDDVLQATTKFLVNNGLVVNQRVVLTSNGEKLLQTTISHTDGGSISDDGIPLIINANSKNPMQELGGCITYARRYGMTSMLGLSEFDNDCEVLTEKPKGNGGQSHRVNELPEPNGAGELFKKSFSTLYDEMSQCKGKKSGDLRKVYTKIVKELKDMDIDKNQPDEFADMEKFKDYLKTTCNQ